MNVELIIKFSSVVMCKVRVNSVSATPYMYFLNNHEKLSYYCETK